MLKIKYCKIGLHLRVDKCEAFSPSGINDRNWQLSVHVKKNVIVVLESPIGHKSFVQDVCLKQADSAKVFLSKLPRLNDAQTVLLILRYCGIPKISHLLRCIPPFVIDTAARELDCTIITTFDSIIGCKLSVEETRQLLLPISLGGVGLTKSSSTSSVDFLSAWASSLYHLPLRDQRMIAICDYISLHGARDCPFNNSSSIGIHLDKTLLEVHRFCETTKQLISS